MQALRGELLALFANQARALLLQAKLLEGPFQFPPPVVEAPVLQSQQLTAFTTLDSGVASRPDSVQALPAQQPAVQTITIARPVRTQVSNARTSASR